MVNIITKINKNIIIKTIIIETGDSLGYYEIYQMSLFNVYKSIHWSVMFFFSTVLCKRLGEKVSVILKPLIDWLSFCWGCRREKSRAKL